MWTTLWAIPPRGTLPRRSGPHISRCPIFRQHFVHANQELARLSPFCDNGLRRPAWIGAPVDGMSQLSSKKGGLPALTAGQKQYIRLSHKIMAYYAAKTDVHSFNQIHSSISDDEKNKIRHESLQKSDYFLSAIKEFKVVSNFRQISYKKHTRSGDASVAQGREIGEWKNFLFRSQSSVLRDVKV